MDDPEAAPGGDHLSGEVTVLAVAGSVTRSGDSRVAVQAWRPEAVEANSITARPSRGLLNLD